MSARACPGRPLIPLPRTKACTVSSADTRRDLENVRQTITYNIDDSQKAIEYLWDKAQTFFAAAVAGYNNLAGMDQVFALFARDNQVLIDFLDVQTPLSSARRRPMVGSMARPVPSATVSSRIHLISVACIWGRCPHTCGRTAALRPCRT